MSRPLRILYFASMRERVGLGEERLDVPSDVDTVAALIGWLAARDESHAHAFEHAGSIRAALDQAHAAHDAALAGAREVAFFPPMTGG